MKFVAVCKSSGKILYQTGSFAEILKFKNWNYALECVDDSYQIGDQFPIKRPGYTMDVGTYVFNPFLQKSFELIRVYVNPHDEKQTLYEFTELNPVNAKMPTLMVTQHPTEYPIIMKG